MLLRTSQAHLLKTTLFDTVRAEEFLVDCREGVLFDRLNGEVQLRRLARETLVRVLWREHRADDCAARRR